MRVELDVFSGRPNPVWQLDARAAVALTALHGALAAGAHGRAPPDLGYRGFAYAVRGVPCRAYGGVVQTPSSVLADSGMTIERFLLAQLPENWSGLAAIVAEQMTPRAS